MKPSEIKVGKTYVNRGKGRTRRSVTGIDWSYKAPWYSSGPRPNEPIVRFAQEHLPGEHFLYLKSFASWAGRELP